MGFTDIVALITAIFKFPNTILEFVKVLQKTPEEKHNDLLKAVAQEASKFENSGRPTW
jgi:hypothetical protein